MGFLITEILMYLAVAALLGFIIAWAIFGGRSKKTAGADPKVVQKQKKEIADLSTGRDRLQSTLQERDAKVAELSYQIDQAAKFRLEAVEDKNKLTQRISKLESALRGRDAEVANLTSGSGGDNQALQAAQARLKERDEALKALRTELTDLKNTSDAAQRISELQAEIKELRATIEMTASGDDNDKDATIARLREEITGLRAAYDAAERSLEEQEGAIGQLASALADSERRASLLRGDSSPALPVVAEAAGEPGVEMPGPPTVGVSTLIGPAPTISPLMADRLTMTEEDPTPAPSVLPQPIHEMVPASQLNGLAFMDMEDSTVGFPPPLPAAVDPDLVTSADAGVLASPAIVAVEAIEEDADPKKTQLETATPKVDDLKRIKGIGPAIERRLHALGIYSWTQIADFDSERISEVCDKIKVSPDRVAKDQWVAQAKTLKSATS